MAAVTALELVTRGKLIRHCIWPYGFAMAWMDGAGCLDMKALAVGKLMAFERAQITETVHPDVTRW